MLVPPLVFEGAVISVTYTNNPTNWVVSVEGDLDPHQATGAGAMPRFRRTRCSAVFAD